MAITARQTPVWACGVVSCLALLGPSAGGLGAAASAASVAPSATTLAGRPSVPAPRVLSELSGVACTSPVNCWAVGHYNKVPLNQALHWNGRRWSQVRTPDPSHGNGSGLGGVSCAAPADCWAVGFYNTATTELNETLHWNGRAWSLVPSPSPSGATSGYSFLVRVRCTSSGNCWAVGAYTTSAAGTTFLAQALHWNGRRWSVIATPSPGGAAAGDRTFLSDVRCASAASCWAAGDYFTAGSPRTDSNLTLHWNGRRWSQVPTPNPGVGSSLSGVACASAASCWAAGRYATAGSPGANLNQALHWNGRAWSLVATPDPDGTGAGAVNGLSDVTCAGPASCWAVGFSAPAGQPSRNQALHWNGTRWTTGLP